MYPLYPPFTGPGDSVNSKGLWINIWEVILISKEEVISPQNLFKVLGVPLPKKIYLRKLPQEFSFLSTPDSPEFGLVPH